MTVALGSREIGKSMVRESQSGEQTEDQKDRKPCGHSEKQTAHGFAFVTVSSMSSTASARWSIPERRRKEFEVNVTIAIEKSNIVQSMKAVGTRGVGH